MSLTELAKAAGIGRPTLERHEQGTTRTNLSPRRLARLATVLATTPSTLVVERDVRRPVAQSTESSFPDVYEYTDAITFFHDAYRHAHEADIHFSQRYLSRKMGHKSSAGISHIFTGRAPLYPNDAVKLARVFGLDAARCKYIRLLTTVALLRQAVKRHGGIVPRTVFKGRRGDISATITLKTR
jgi:transcriptional regulator with XRE-family HTH domain